MPGGVAVSANWALSAYTALASAFLAQTPPPLTVGDPAPGARVRRTIASYDGHPIFHALYLPTNWQAGHIYPVIVEWPPNFFSPADISGEIDDCHMGYYLSDGADYIWVTMPLVAYQENPIIHSTQWWGLEFTPEDPFGQGLAADYAVEALQEVLENYGGDPAHVFATGFSRGAIACGYIALANDDIADAWAGFLPHSFADGDPFTPTGVAARRARIKGRPSLISWGGDDGDGAISGVQSADALTALSYPVATLAIPGVGHDDNWIVTPSASRDTMRAWLTQMIADNPGTVTINGRVTDSCGNGVAGARIESGALHFTRTDANGNYALAGLTRGSRTITAMHIDYDFPHPSQPVTLHTSDVHNVNFLASARPRPWEGLPVQLLYASTGATSHLGLKLPCAMNQLYVASGQLPPGMSIDPANRSLVGAPALGGAYQFTLRAVYADGSTDDYPVQLVVYGRTAVAERECAATKAPGRAAVPARATRPAIAEASRPFQSTGAAE